MGAVALRGCWRSTASVADVWDVLVDLTTWPDWWPAIRHVEPTDPSDSGLVAARVTFSTRPPMRPLVTTLEVVEQHQHERLHVVVTDGPLAGQGSFTIGPDREGSRSCYDVSLAVRSLLFRPLEPILRSGTRTAGRERLARAGADLARLAGGEPLPEEQG